MYFFPCSAISTSLWCWRSRKALPLTNTLRNGDAHAPGSALNHLDGALQVNRVQVLHLLLGNLADLVPGEITNLGPAWRGGALFRGKRLFDQVHCRRGLNDKGEGPVLKNGNLRRDNHPRLGSGALVVLFAEGHYVHAVLAQGWTDRRRRRCLAGNDLQLHNGLDFLRHQDLLYKPSAISEQREASSKRNSPLLLASCLSLQLCPLHLEKVQLHRSLSAEEGHQHPNFALLRVDVVHHAGKVGERAIYHLDSLATREADLHLRRLAPH